MDMNRSVHIGDTEQETISIAKSLQPSQWATRDLSYAEARRRIEAHNNAVAEKRNPAIAAELEAREEAQRRATKEREVRDPFRDLSPVRVSPTRVAVEPAPGFFERAIETARELCKSEGGSRMLVLLLAADGSVQRRGPGTAWGVVFCRVTDRITPAAMELASACRPSGPATLVQLCSADGSVFWSGHVTHEAPP